MGAFGPTYFYSFYHVCLAFGAFKGTMQFLFAPQNLFMTPKGFQWPLMAFFGSYGLLMTPRSLELLPGALSKASVPGGFLWAFPGLGALCRPLQSLQRP